MKKFKLQKGIISGTLAISMLFSGCSKTNEDNQITNSPINTNIDEIQYEGYSQYLSKYLIRSCEAKKLKNEDGTITYEIPESLKDLNYILCGDTCYKVYELKGNNTYVTICDMEKASLIVQDSLNDSNNEKELIEPKTKKAVEYLLDSDGNIKAFITEYIEFERAGGMVSLPAGYRLVIIDGRQYGYRESIQKFPLTVEIEQIELEDGKIGYKLPAQYKPYAVNNEYNLPSMLEIIEQTEDYTIYEISKEIDANGVEVDTSLDGAIGVYEIYADEQSRKLRILSKYGMDYNANAIDDYSFASEVDQIALASIDSLHSKIAEAYYENKGRSLKR